MSKYTRKKNKPTGGRDEFVSFWQRAYEQLVPYGRPIGITIATAVVVWFVGYQVLIRRESRREDVSEGFSRAVHIYEGELLTDATPAKPVSTDEENPVPRFKTAGERANATLSEIDQLKKSYSGTKVVEQLEVFSAGVLFDLGRYDEAAKLYDSYLSSTDRSSVVGILAQESRGLCAEATGKLDEALAAYASIEPSSESRRGDFYRDRALYDQARIKAKKGDTKGATDLYQQILTKIPGTPLREQVQTQLALLGAP
jgi:tetratricopeptide (TPR) repeat protein